MSSRAVVEAPQGTRVTMSIDDEACDITDMAAGLLAVGASHGSAPGEDTVVFATLEADPEVRFALHGEPLGAEAALDLIGRGIAVALAEYLSHHRDDCPSGEGAGAEG